MQVKRQRISFSLIIFIWLTLFGIQHLILELVRDNEDLRSKLGIILPVILLVVLIGLVVGAKYLVRDDMITTSKTDYLMSRILGYIAAVPIIILILFDYIIKDNDNLAFIVNLTASLVLIVVGIVGTVYFGILINQKPRPPFSKKGTIIDAEFRETDKK